MTVSWIVMAASGVALALGAMAVLSGGVENLSNDTSQTLANAEPGSEELLQWGTPAPAEPVIPE